MRLNIVQLALREHARGHVAVLQPVVGEYGGGQIAAQVHIAHALYVQRGEFVVALPERLKRGRVHGAQRLQKPLRLRDASGQSGYGKALRVRAHLLGRGDDDLHFATS